MAANGVVSNTVHNLLVLHLVPNTPVDNVPTNIVANEFVTSNWIAASANHVTNEVTTNVLLDVHAGADVMTGDNDSTNILADDTGVLGEIQVAVNVLTKILVKGAYIPGKVRARTPQTSLTN